MSNLILPAVSKLPLSAGGDPVSASPDAMGEAIESIRPFMDSSAGGDPVSVFALIAGVCVGVFALALWRQFKAGEAA